jgi:hypothetical protein
MPNCQHFHRALFGKRINDAVLAHNEFSDGFDVKFRHDAPNAGKIFEQKKPVDDFFGTVSARVSE